MSATNKSAEAEAAATDSLPIGRWIAVLVILIAEYLLLSFLFDAQQLAGNRGWKSILGSLGDVGPIAIAIATATIVLRYQTLQSEVHQLRSELRTKRRLWPVVIGHTVAYVALLLQTSALVVDSTTAPGLWTLIAWVLLAATNLATLLIIALPLQILRDLIVRLWPTLALGAAAGLAAWLAGTASASLWRPLALFTLVSVATILDPILDNVATYPDTLFLGAEDFAVTVAPECSGYEGVGLALVLLSMYLWIFRKRLRYPQALLLLPASVVLVWCLNVLRIALLVVVGARISPEIAIGGFHSKAGWVLFCGFSLAVVALTQRSAFFVTERKTPVRASWNPTAAHVAPLFTITIVTLITGLVSTSSFDPLYGVRILATAGVLYAYRNYHTMSRWSWSWEAAGIGLVAYLLWIVLQPASDPGHVEQRLAELHRLGTVGYLFWVGFRVFGSVIIVPIAEELAFRGFLLRRLIATRFETVSPRRITFPSIALSSFAFGVLHQAWVAGTVVGVLFAFAQCRRGNINDAILAHGTANVLVAAHVLIVGEWSLWL